MWGKGNKSSNSRVEKIDTLIASNVEIQGDVHFSGGIQIDGTVKGNVIANEEKGAMVRITNQGKVEGEIKGPNVIINGKVEGDVISTEHLELAAKAVVTGNVHYNLIEMVMGAEVNGNLLHITDLKEFNKPSEKADTKTGSSKSKESSSKGKKSSLTDSDTSDAAAVSATPTN